MGLRGVEPLTSRLSGMMRESGSTANSERKQHLTPHATAQTFPEAPPEKRTWRIHGVSTLTACDGERECRNRRTWTPETRQLLDAARWTI